MRRNPETAAQIIGGTILIVATVSAIIGTQIIAGWFTTSLIVPLILSLLVLAGVVALANWRRDEAMDWLREWLQRTAGRR